MTEAQAVVVAFQVVNRVAVVITSHKVLKVGTITIPEIIQLVVAVAQEK